MQLKERTILKIYINLYLSIIAYNLLELKICDSTGRFRKSGPFCFCTLFKKNYRAQNKLCNTLGIVFPLRKTHLCTGKTIPKLLYRLFWAL